MPGQPPRPLTSTQFSTLLQLNSYPCLASSATRYRLGLGSPPSRSRSTRVNMIDPSPGLLIILTLLGLVQAAPHSLNQSQPTTNVFLERATARIKNTDGSVALDRLQREFALLSNKYERNLNNLNNMESVRDVNATAKRIQKRAAQSLSMPSEGIWTGPVYIGTPAKKFSIYFDTGSADMTLASNKCPNSSCGSKTRYNVGQSSTGKSTGGQVETNYVDGTTTEGSVVTDTVKVGGISVTKQAIISSTSMSKTVKGLPSDGLLGLAFSELSASGLTTLPWTQYAQDTTHSRFGLRLSNTAGASLITFGGISPNHIAGDLTWYKVGKTKGAWSYTYWQVANSAAYINNKVVSTSRVQYILDSGTTLIVAPLDGAKKFWAKVPGSKKHDSQSWTYPCKNAPKVGFVLGGTGRQWMVSASSQCFHRPGRNFFLTYGLIQSSSAKIAFNLGHVSGNTTRCLGAVVGMDLGLGSAWILGDSFLTGVYAAFDVKNRLFGLADPK
ncbi:BQ5605_C020g09161 [Microbotryum silenes-dioicae]|uniref:BQ5605_C020g09161 protein n=1 Tax=Microbotryum silenes-dioicae TaxID=796604 RepID=A0A2X0N5Q7_9BASI|nr:BQ5605_C020g09161 [Microbotryum silenes-dioicae]